LQIFKTLEEDGIKNKEFKWMFCTMGHF